MTFWEFLHWLVDTGNRDMAVAELVSHGWPAADADLWATGRHRARSFEVTWL